MKLPTLEGLYLQFCFEANICRVQLDWNTLRLFIFNRTLERHHIPLAKKSLKITTIHLNNITTKTLKGRTK